MSDDTIEVHEIRAKNSGRDDSATLISRQLVPKSVEPMPQRRQVGSSDHPLPDLHRHGGNLESRLGSAGNRHRLVR